MATINSAEFNSTASQLKNVFYQLGASSNAFGEAGTYINSVFGIGSNIEQLATGDDSQKTAAIQGLIDQAMNLVSRLVNIQTDANNKVKEDKEKAEKVSEKAVETEANLNNCMQEISVEINNQTSIVENASQELQKTQENLALTEQKINEIIKKIQEEQNNLKKATTAEEKRAILNNIEALSGDISSLMVNIDTYQETLENNAAVVEEAFTNIETAKGNAVQKQQDGQLKIVENTQQATEAVTSTASTQAEGVQNIALGTALEGTAAAENIIPIVGTALSANTAQKGAELIAAGTTETTGSLSNLTSLLQGVGKIANNTQLLSTFKTAIGGALGGFNNSIGSWNSIANPFIESLGSLTSANLGSQFGVLDQAVATDMQTLDSYQNGETKPIEPKVTVTKSNGNSEDAEFTGTPYKLITPNIKLSFGI